MSKYRFIYFVIVLLNLLVLSIHAIPKPLVAYPSFGRAPIEYNVSYSLADPCRGLNSPQLLRLDESLPSKCSELFQLTTLRVIRSNCEFAKSTQPKQRPKRQLVLVPSAVNGALSLAHWVGLQMANQNEAPSTRQVFEKVKRLATTTIGSQVLTESFISISDANSTGLSVSPFKNPAVKAKFANHPIFNLDPSKLNLLAEELLMEQEYAFMSRFGTRIGDPYYGSMSQDFKRASSKITDSFIWRLMGAFMSYADLFESLFDGIFEDGRVNDAYAKLFSSSSICGSEEICPRKHWKASCQCGYSTSNGTLEGKIDSFQLLIRFQIDN